jgi:hypothetical protein
MNSDLGVWTADDCALVGVAEAEKLAAATEVAH